MDKLLHALAILAAALSHAHLTNPHALTNDQQYDAGLATYGGVTAWWGSTGEDPKVAHLMVRTRQGKVMALPPTLSELATTIDVGRAPDGEPLITYAQCGRTAASCQGYAYSLKTRRQFPLHLGDGQAVAVALDGNQVAWFRQPHAYGPSQLLIGQYNGFGVARPRRLRLAPVYGEPIGQPLALDLRGGRIAYAANEGGEDIRTEVLRAGTPDHMETISDDGSYGEGCTRVEVAPTLTPGALTWMEGMYGRRSECRPASNKLIRRTWAGVVSHAELPVRAAKEAVVVGDGGHVATLAPHDTTDDEAVRSACHPDDLFNDEGAGSLGCEARLVRAPRWLAGHGS
jgi:hypothetical protein